MDIATDGTLPGGSPSVPFYRLGLDERICRALREIGYRRPTEIQSRVIPQAIRGMDVSAAAPTGTGKTAAFTLPILQLLNNDGSASGGLRLLQRRTPDAGNTEISALVVSPTRELAEQIHVETRRYAKYVSVRSVVIYGGVSQAKQEDELAKGANVLVATPGRLLDLIQQGIVDLSRVKIAVLDEADQMLDMGFIDDVREILGYANPKQMMLFSATLNSEVEALIRQFMRSPVRVAVDHAKGSIVEELYIVGWHKKQAHLRALIRRYRMRRALVFCRTKRGADHLVRYLRNNRIRAEAFHGDKSQTNRSRSLAMFKRGVVHVLVCTDVAARGVDIESVSHVVNFDLPTEPVKYVHRIGRTGRAGRHGRAITFAVPNERHKLRMLESFIGRAIPPADSFSGQQSSMHVEKPTRSSGEPSLHSRSVQLDSPNGQLETRTSVRLKLLRAIQEADESVLIEIMKQVPNL